VAKITDANEHAAVPMICDVLVGEQVVTLGGRDFLLVPPSHGTRVASANAGVDMLFITPGVERFEYFRLGDRIRKGEASPQQILDAQDRFDNHFHDSLVWRQFLRPRLLSQTGRLSCSIS
jgi:hypothetical protein